MKKNLQLHILLIFFLLSFFLPGNVLAKDYFDTIDSTFDCSLVTGVPLAECQALVDLFNSTGGNSWINKSGWLETNTPCTDWHGVSCTSGRVTQINLPSNNLQGVLPSSLGNCTNLQVLNLGLNGLSGDVHSWLGNLSQLTMLKLGFNQFTNTIPETLGLLSKLQVLELTNNKLTGSIPSQLGNLKNVYHLALDRNLLTGSIPPELGSMTSLSRLSLGNNSISGPIPIELCNAINLYNLDFHNAQLTGTIPTCINKLTKLQWFSVDNNNMEGTIPIQFSELKQLRGIQLLDNNFSGPLPSWIGNIRSLEELALGGNNFDGKIPWEIGNLTNLLTLDLSNNNFWGEIPSTIVNLTKLNTTYIIAYTDIGYNHLFAVDSNVIAFLDSKDPDWRDTQSNLTEFYDVHPDHWAAPYISAIYKAGITGGCKTDPLLYCPEASVIRGDMAIFLERGINGSAFVPPVAEGIFTDVPLDAYYANWVEQLYADGITGGCSVDPMKYCPLFQVSRDQMAVFLLRSKHGSDYTPPAAEGIFTDVDPTSFFAPWIEQLAEEGITAGCGVNVYCPSNPVTREQMAVFLARTFNLMSP